MKSHFQHSHGQSDTPPVSQLTSLPIFTSALLNVLPLMNFLSVCLPESDFATNSGFFQMCCDGALYHPPHTLVKRGRDRRGPISISVPHLNPRESRVVSGFSLCRRSCSSHETCFSSFQENFLEEKIANFFFLGEKLSPFAQKGRNYEKSQTA